MEEYFKSNEKGKTPAKENMHCRICAECNWVRTRADEELAVVDGVLMEPDRVVYAVCRPNMP